MQFEMMMLATTLSVIRSAVDARVQAVSASFMHLFLQFFLKLDLKVCRGDTSLYLEYLTIFLVRGELRNQGCCSFLPNAKNAPPPSGKGRGQTSKCMPPPGSLYCIVEGLGGGFHWVTLTIKLTN